MPFGSARNAIELMCIIAVVVPIDTGDMLNDLSV